jgi:hypothetical protein
MNIDKKANEYWSSLSKPLADEQGLVETAYAAGALDQLNELKPSDEERNFWCENSPEKPECNNQCQFCQGRQNNLI